MLSKTNYEMLFCAPQWGQTIRISTCHLSIDFFFLLPSNHSIFITLTALWFWDFKAEFVVGLLKQSIWKCVQPWGWVVNFFGLQSWLWRWNKAAKPGTILCCGVQSTRSVSTQLRHQQGPQLYENVDPLGVIKLRKRRSLRCLIFQLFLNSWK